MDVYWLEQTTADLPSDNAWLNAGEANRLRLMRFPKRRADWILGRWTAKNAAAIFLDIPPEPRLLREIEIRPARSGAPEVFVGDDLALIQISISHRDGVAACAFTRSSALLGCDLELVEPHSDAFVADYFAEEEQAFLAQAAHPERLLLQSLFWSAKESALKALREGLRLDPRQMIVSIQDSSEGPRGNIQGSLSRPSPSAHTLFPGEAWKELEVRNASGQTFKGWWSQTGDLLRTILAVPAPGRPTFLTNQVPLSGVGGSALQKIRLN